MAALETIASLAAVVSALADVYTIAKEPFENYLVKRRKEITTNNVPADLIAFFGSYSDDEVKKIEERLLKCRAQFIAEGDGENRRTCLCSVLKHVHEGNAGLPSGPWSELANQLKCGLNNAPPGIVVPTR